jgi:GH3 auxin-responsive promoter
MWQTALQRALGSRLSRSAADAWFAHYARRRVRGLDACNAASHQERMLLRLVRSAQRTRFGLEHGFRSIQSVRDFQRRVPLRTYEAFWSGYWQQTFPHLTDVTWPGRVPYLALSSGTTTGATKYIPVSEEMLASNRKAALTALSWFRAAHPRIPLFGGRMFLLGGSTDLTPPDRAYPGTKAGDLSAIVAGRLPRFLDAYSYPPRALALERDWDKKLSRLAAESATLPITLVSGVPSWLLALFERLRQVTGRERIADIWPKLRLIVHGGTRFEPYEQLFRETCGPDVHFLETYPASEGFVAAEDPRHGLLRLIPDHGVFFEFVPVEDLDSPVPTRHALGDVVAGVNYAVVLSTCAGLWAYLLGDTVRFESREPPLLRFTGRTGQFLSAFGEHLIGEEVEQAITEATARTGSRIADYHVGPVYPAAGAATGHHVYLVEFLRAPHDEALFAQEIDNSLCRQNEDYRAHRAGAIDRPKVLAVRDGGFLDWMRSRGQLGGQHKVPRIDSTGRLTRELMTWLEHQPTK